MKVLGLDYGDRRIGVAVSDPSCKLALMRETLRVSSEDEAVKLVRKIADSEGIDRIVIGMPLNMDGTLGSRAERTKEFAARLEQTTGIAIEFWDERLTSSIAKRTLFEAGRNATKRDGRIDKVSAILILQGYLDRLCASEEQKVVE